MRDRTERRLLTLFGQRFAEIRRNKNLTQCELAERVDMSVVGIAYIETGRRWVRLGTLAKIADALEADLVDFFDFHKR